MSEIKVKCNQCLGEGWYSGGEHAGAEYHTEDGECTGYCPVQVQIQCGACKGMGYVMEYEPD